MKPKDNTDEENRKYHERFAALLESDTAAVEELASRVGVRDPGPEHGTSPHVRLALALVDAGYGPGDL